MGRESDPLKLKVSGLALGGAWFWLIDSIEKLLVNIDELRRVGVTLFRARLLVARSRFRVEMDLEIERVAVALLKEPRSISKDIEEKKKRIQRKRNRLLNMSWKCVSV